MKPLSLRIDYDETGRGKFKVKVSYHERDTSERLGQSVDVIVYIPSEGRTLPDAGREISAAAISKAREFLRRILDETENG